MPTASAKSILTGGGANPASSAPTDPPAPSGPRPPAPPSEAEAREIALVHAHLAGDPSALAELLGSYQDRLYGVCLRMIGNPEHARDLTQDAMVKIIQGIDRFSGRSKLSTWMIRVTMNVCLTELRRLKLRRHASLDQPIRGGKGASDAPTHGAGLPSGEPDAPSGVERRETLARLSEALALIGHDQRALLILRDMQSLDYRQIAELLDVPVGTVKSRLFRARAALREQIEALEQGRGPDAEPSSGPD